MGANLTLRLEFARLWAILSEKRANGHVFELYTTDKGGTEKSCSGWQSKQLFSEAT